MIIHGDLGSGNCLKVKWTADLCAHAYEWRHVDIMKGEARTAAFAAMNPAMQTPTVDFGDGKYLAQSNAIIRYLARGTRLLPDDPWTQAKIDEWLFWEQYSHEPYIARCRFQMKYLGWSADKREAWRVDLAGKALERMETALAGRVFLVGDAFTIADIALYAYTHVAHEGGFDLSARSHVQAWLARCAAELSRGKGSAP
jgi:glutathione S-transferase